MKRTVAPRILALVILLPGSLVSQQTGSPVLLPGTALRVPLPAGWKLEPPRRPPQLHLLTTTTEPRYELWVSQSTPKTTGCFVRSHGLARGGRFEETFYCFSTTGSSLEPRVRPHVVCLI